MWVVKIGSGSARVGHHAGRGPLPGVAAATVALVLSLPATPAAAFSDFNRYADPTSDGGTDGRYFTGSPMDGYGCNACHQGAEGIQVSVSGLPEDSYELGASYEVTVRFEHPEGARTRTVQLLK